MAEQPRSTEQGRTGERDSMVGRRPGSRGMMRRDPFFEAWDQPFGLLRRFTDDLDRLFGAPLGSRLGGPSSWMGSWQPSLDVFRRENNLVVRADLPGLTKDDVNVEITDDAILIRGERREEREEEQDDVYLRERSYGSFSRTIPMPEDVDVQQTRATFKNGTLEVVVPLTEQARSRRSRRIEITEGGQAQAESKTKAAGSGGNL